jgi:hypothetical protein
LRFFSNAISASCCWFNPKPRSWKIDNHLSGFQRKQTLEKNSAPDVEEIITLSRGGIRGERIIFRSWSLDLS